MRFSLGLPTDQVEFAAEFVTGPAVMEMAARAESLGFDACHVTDHPAPDKLWLDTGGHHALDPMVALAFAAAATTRVALQTHVYVLPYRNPFLAAKSVLSLDVLSGGRVLLGVAAGYLRPEFSALGVDFDERNELLVESIEVCKRVWTEDVVAFDGRHFRSRGTTMQPRVDRPNRPHPPIWIGGNSRTAMRRAVEIADGWAPFPNPPATTRALKTPTLVNVDDLAARIAEMHDYAVDIGRTAPLDVCFAPTMGTQFGASDYTADDLRAEVAALEAVGVTWLTIGIRNAETRTEWTARVDRLAADLQLTPAGGATS